MKKLMLAFILPGLLTVACAQQKASPVKYAQIINAALAKKHLDILASDAFEGRETGKPGAGKAARYIADEFKSLGLLPIVNGSYFFDVPLVENLSNVSCSVNGQSFVKGRDFYAPRPVNDTSFSKPEVVFVGFGTDSETAGMDLKDKILLWINEDKPQAGIKTNTGFRLSDPRLKILASLQSKSPAIIFATNVDATQVIKRFSGSSGSRLSIEGGSNKVLPMAGLAG